MAVTLLITTLALGAACRAPLHTRAASRMCAGPPSERDASPRRAMLRDAAGLALGTALGSTLGPFPALAAKNGIRAASQGQQVNKDPQSLLRLGLPIDCPAARSVQQELEELRGNAQKALWNKVCAPRVRTHPTWPRRSGSAAGMRPVARLTCARARLLLYLACRRFRTQNRRATSWRRSARSCLRPLLRRTKRKRALCSTGARTCVKGSHTAKKACVARR